MAFNFFNNNPQTPPSTTTTTTTTTQSTPAAGIGQSSQSILNAQQQAMSQLYNNSQIANSAITSATYGWGTLYPAGNTTLTYGTLNGYVQGQINTEPKFTNPREMVIYQMLQSSQGELHYNIARRISAMLDAMHIQECFDLEHKLI